MSVIREQRTVWRAVSYTHLDVYKRQAFGYLKVPVYKAFGDIYKVPVKSKTLNSLF